MCIGTLGAIGAAASAAGALLQRHRDFPSRLLSRHGRAKQRELSPTPMRSAPLRRDSSRPPTRACGTPNNSAGSRPRWPPTMSTSNSGSALDVQVSQRAKGQLDARTALQKAQVESYGYRVNAVSNGAESQLDQFTAANAPIGASLGAFGSLAGNARFTSWIGGTDASPFNLPNIWSRAFHRLVVNSNFVRYDVRTFIVRAAHGTLLGSIELTSDGAAGERYIARLRNLEGGIEGRIYVRR